MALHVIHVDAIGSASDVVLGLSRHDVPEHTTVVAAREFASRGGSGRWEAPPGGLWLTTLWRPHLDVRRAGLLTLAAAWGLREGVLRHTGLASELKWPNDLLVAGRRLGSVAVEGRVEGRRVVAAAVAIGLNVNNPLGGLSPPVSARATSLAREMNDTVTLEDLLEDVSASLRDARALVDDPVRLVASFTAAWGQRGRDVSIDAGHALVQGLATRIDADGALVVSTDSGEHRLDDPALAKFVHVVG